MLDGHVHIELSAILFYFLPKSKDVISLHTLLEREIGKLDWQCMAIAKDKKHALNINDEQ